MGFKNGLAISYEKLGKTHAALGDLPLALTFFEQYNQLEKELHDAYPQNVGFKNGLAVSYSKLGGTYTVLGDLPRASTFFEQCNQLLKELYEAYMQNVSFKSNYAESLAVLYAAKKLTNRATANTSDLDTAMHHFEALFSLTQTSYYQNKLTLCQQIRVADNDELKRLITEMSAF